MSYFPITTSLWQSKRAERYVCHDPHGLFIVQIWIEADILATGAILWGKNWQHLGRLQLGLFLVTREELNPAF